MIDAILSHHANGHTCGVAKFNLRLAKELGVPCLPLGVAHHTVSHPLFSVMDCEDPDWAQATMSYGPRRYSLFLHDAWKVDSLCDQNTAVTSASLVFASNAEIATTMRLLRPDVVTSCCPATVHGDLTRGAINVLTFGMAHKIQAARYEKLKTLLDATGRDYTLSLSTAVHEGTPWDLTATVPDTLRAIFGDRLRVLGYLADDALAKELHECTAVALFYDPALRANNTSFWSAYDAQKAIVTNLDAYSPMGVGLDLDAMGQWVDLYRWFDRPRVTSAATWPGLLAQIRQTVAG